MNGSEDEQHDAHLMCYIEARFADAVANAYDRHLAAAGSTGAKVTSARRARRSSGVPVAATDEGQYDEHVRAYRAYTDAPVYGESYRARARQAYVAELADAWKNPSPVSSSFPGDDDAFFRAVMVYHERGDIDLLLDLVRSDQLMHLSDENREHLAGLVKLVDARSRPRRKATPGGEHLRWEDLTYVATWLAEHRIDAIKAAVGKDGISAVNRAAVIEATAQEVESWHVMRGKPQLKRTRMLELLRGPKSRRLKAQLLIRGIRR
jgi:hypothetical protein